MAEINQDKDPNAGEALEFIPIGHQPVSSSTVVAKATPVAEPLVFEPDHLADLSPIDRELAVPVLPPLEKADRARLLMQSPNRIHFYWSVGSNPFQSLTKALGSDSHGYQLVIRLIDRTRDTEQIIPAEYEGSTWFTVESATKYQAELGFYATNRPFVRVIFSNEVETPRKTPSPHTAESAEWRIPSHQFARILDVSGFRQDAFDVAIAGDDAEAASGTAARAVADLTGQPPERFSGFDSEELRFSLFSIASGATFEDLRYQISPSLFAILQQNTGWNKDAALAAARREYGVDEVENEIEETGSAVFGLSSIHFPRRLRFRQVPGRSISSHTFR